MFATRQVPPSSNGVLKIDFPPDTLCITSSKISLEARDWTRFDIYSTATMTISPWTSFNTVYFHLPRWITFRTRSSRDAEFVALREIWARYPDVADRELRKRTGFECFTHGPFTITPVKATHILDEDCHNLIIERDGKRMLYATDTGIWPERTFDFLKDYPLDLLVIECTDGFSRSPAGTWHTKPFFKSSVDSAARGAWQYFTGL